MKRIGREAIEVLKGAYMDGKRLEGPAAVRAFVIMALGVRPKTVRITAATEWDRQARYELADERIAITSPVAVNRYLRDPNADEAARREAREARQRDLKTRVTNQRRLAEADADQPDAARSEILLAERLRIAEEILNTP